MAIPQTEATTQNGPAAEVQRWTRFQNDTAWRRLTARVVYLLYNLYWTGSGPAGDRAARGRLPEYATARVVILVIYGRVPAVVRSERVCVAGRAVGWRLPSYSWPRLGRAAGVKIVRIDSRTTSLEGPRADAVSLSLSCLWDAISTGSMEACPVNSGRGRRLQRSAFSTHTHTGSRSSTA